MVTTLSVVATAFVACAALLTPDFLASPRHRYLAWGPGDTQLEVTSNALAAARTSLDGTAVFILGSSGIREAITNCDELREALASRSPHLPLRVFNCASWDQTPIEMTALIEQLPRSFDGVVVLGINPCDIGAGPLQHHRDAAHAFDLRLGFRSDIIDEAARSAGVRVPWRTGNCFVDNYRFFLPRLPFLLRNLFLGPPEERSHPWTVLTEQIDEAGWHSQAERVQRLMSDYDSRFDETLVYYERMIAELERRGNVRVVLLESPIRPRSIEETIGVEVWDDHVARMQAFAARTGIRYWNLNERAKLRNEDFYDYVHVYRPEAQERFTQALSEALEGIF